MNSEIHDVSNFIIVWMKSTGEMEYNKRWVSLILKKNYGNDLHASVHYNSHCNVKVRVREKYTCTTLSFSKTP